MAAILAFAMHHDDADDTPAKRRARFRRWWRKHFTWVHVTRVVGLIGLGYEIVVDKIDKPSVVIVLGAMILGAESVRGMFWGGDR